MAFDRPFVVPTVHVKCTRRTRLSLPLLVIMAQGLVASVGPNDVGQLGYGLAVPYCGSYTVYQSRSGGVLNWIS
jgi:hypothetical protein